MDELVKFLGFSGFAAFVSLVVYIANLGFHIKKLQADTDAAHKFIREVRDKLNDIDKNVLKLESILEREK